MRPVVVKLGGSLIARSPRLPAPGSGILRRLGREIAAAGRRAVVVHGTGAFGKPPAERYGYLDGRIANDGRVPVAEIKSRLLSLQAAVVAGLCRSGVRAVAASAADLLRVRAGRISAVDAAPLERWLALGMTPTLCGDILADESGDLRVCSSDEIACALARALDARRVVFATDVDFVLREDGTPVVRLSYGERLVLPRSPRDVSGGMAGKLRAALALARRGTPSLVVNGLKPGRLNAALRGRHVAGTLVAASRVSAAAAGAPNRRAPAKRRASPEKPFASARRPERAAARDRARASA